MDKEKRKKIIQEIRKGELIGLIFVIPDDQD